MIAVVLPAALLLFVLASSSAVLADSPGATFPYPSSERAKASALTSFAIPALAISNPVSVAPPVREDATQSLAKGMFLIASRDLKDPNFERTVVLLVEYDTSGAMGLVINRPTNLALSMVLPAMRELEERTDTVFIGGPVAQDRLVLLIRTKVRPDESQHVFEDIYVSGSRAALEQMLQTVEPNQNFHAYVGYAGWAPGQLEGEVERGDWLLSSANGETVFDKESSEVWPELIRQNSGLWVKHQVHGQRRHVAAMVCFGLGAGC